MAYKASPQFMVAQALDQISDTPVVPVGTRIRGIDPVYGEGEFIYLKGVANTAIGDFVTFDGLNGLTTRLVANAIGPVAIALSACVANKYGWYQIYGLAIGNVLAAFADNANCYATATAGSVDDAIVAGDRVKNCKGASAIGTPSGNFALMEIQHPFMDDGLAA